MIPISNYATLSAYGLQNQQHELTSYIQSILPRTDLSISFDKSENLTYETQPLLISTCSSVNTTHEIRLNHTSTPCSPNFQLHTKNSNNEKKRFLTTNVM
ncbi:hypothetical protein QQ045_025289 [Rhodiola kirilowii]